MIFFRRHCPKAPVSLATPVTHPLTVDIAGPSADDERETSENEPSSTPVALSPVEKTVNVPLNSSSADLNGTSTTIEHLSLKHPGLLRLFDSSVCTASIVISYLFSTKEPLVQQFLGKKLFDYSTDELDFYLPQLINMYIHIPSICNVIHEYITQR